MPVTYHLQSSANFTQTTSRLHSEQEQPRERSRERNYVRSLGQWRQVGHNKLRTCDPATLRNTDFGPERIQGQIFITFALFVALPSLPVKVAGIPRRSCQRHPYQIAALHLAPNDRAETSLISPLDRELRQIFSLRMRALYRYGHKNPSIA